MVAKNVLLSFIALCMMCVPACASSTGTGNLLAYSVLVADYSRTSGGYSPALSPDGRSLAFMSSEGDIWLSCGDIGGNGSTTAPWKLSVPSLPGDISTPAVMDECVARNIDWSRDGTGFTFGGKDGRLFVADQVDPRKRTANVRALGVQRGYSVSLMRVLALGNPRWSPDGKRIAYLRENPKDTGAYQLCVVDLAKESERILASDVVTKGLAWEQPWSPDGRELVYSSLTKTGSVRKVGLSIISLDGTKPRRLKVPEGSTSPTWSSNGSIAFVADKNVKVPVASGIDAGIGASAVWVLDAADGRPRLLSEPLASVEANMPAVTSSARAQFRAVFKERLGSKLTPEQQARLANGKMTNDEISDLLWLIPSRSVGGEFWRLSEAFVRLTRAQRSKKNPDVAAMQKASDAALAALPESKADAFFKNSLGVVYEVSSRIWRDRYASDRYPVWSPDGKRLAFVRSGASNESETLVVIDSRKGAEKRIYSAGQIDCVSWTKDSRALIIQTRRLMSVKRPGANGEPTPKDTLESGVITTTPGYPEIWMLQLDPRPQAARVPDDIADEQDEPEQASNLNRIYLSPGRVGLQAGTKQQFHVCAVDAAGNEVPLDNPAVWESDSNAGAISTDGLFTPGDRVGVHEASVRVTVGKLTASATVEILPKLVQGGYLLERVIGGFRPGLFCTPCAVAVDAEGCIYVADRGNQSLQKLDRDGIPVGYLDASDLSRGSVYVQPESVAVDSKGHIFVCGYGGVKKFDSSMKLVSEWQHTSKIGDHLWQSGFDVAVDSVDNLYVVNSSADRIEKFDASGKLIATLSCAGRGEGKIRGPSGIAIDPDGSIYVSDGQDQCVYKLSASGEPLLKFGLSQKTEERLLGPCGVAVGENGQVYVWDGSTNRLQVYDANGKYVATSERQLRLRGWSSFSGNVAVDKAGNVLVANADESIVQKFDHAGKFLASYGIPGVINGSFHAPSAIATDAANNLYVVDRNSTAIQKFDSNGTHLLTWSGYNMMNLNSFFQAGPDGKCYAGSGGKIVQFDGSAGPPWFDIPGFSLAQQESLCDAVITESGTVYALVSSDNSVNIRKREPGGDVVTIYDSLKHPDQPLGYDSSIAIDKENRIYVANIQWASAARILPDASVEKLEITTAAGEKASRTQDVATDSSGNVHFVAMAGNCVYHLVTLDKAGRTSTSFSFRDHQPMNLAVADDGRIYAINPYEDSSVRVYAPKRD